MQKVTVISKMSIATLLPDGFECHDIEDKRLIKKSYFIRDNIFKNTNHPFNKEDIIKIRIENISEKEIKNSEDYIDEKMASFYAVVYESVSNGIYTKEYDSEENLFKRTFFYRGRGLITLPEFEKSNRFEQGDCLKIILRL